MGAVVWTDLLQMAVIVFAVVYSLVLVAGDVPGGLGAVMEHAEESGRLEVVTEAADRASHVGAMGRPEHPPQ